MNPQILSVVPRPKPAASPRNLVEIRILGPCPRPTESQTLSPGAVICVLTSSLGEPEARSGLRITSVRKQVQSIDSGLSDSCYFGHLEVCHLLRVPNFWALRPRGLWLLRIRPMDPHVDFLRLCGKGRA